MGLNFRVFCMNFDFVIYKKVWKRERKRIGKFLILVLFMILKGCDFIVCWGFSDRCLFDIKIDWIFR